MGMDILTEIISDCSELKKSIPSKGIVNRYPLSTDKFQSILNSMKKLDSESQMGYDDLFTKQICVFIEEWLSLHSNKERNNEPFALMIHGHPSSGKSTAMRQIFKHFSSQIQTTGKPRKVIPIFPNECRVRDITYNSTVDVTIVESLYDKQDNLVDMKLEKKYHIIFLNFQRREQTMPQLFYREVKEE